MAKPKLNKSAIKHMLKFFGFSKAPVTSIAAVMAAGFALGVAYEESVGIGTWHSFHSDTDKINLCFTPPSGCGSLIANEIVKSRSSLYMQAYGLTSPAIIYQLKAARSRGVDVSVILDSGNLSNNDAIYHELKNSGVNVFLDKMSGIAHNKVIIIDKTKIITGSFNFTNAADTRNAENVVLIEDKNIAHQYLLNWKSRKNQSKY